MTRALPSPDEARAIREAAGVSKRRLARELGVHEYTLARWERGDFHPASRSLRRYVELLAALKAEAGASS